MYSSHLDTQGELHFLDMCKFVNKVEYEHFVFPLDSMHKSFGFEDFVFDCYIQGHVDMNFHSEKDEERNSSFCMHYKNGFVSPNLLMRRSNVCSEADVNDTYSLPQRDVNENHVFDRGRKFLEVLVAYGHPLV